MHSPAFPQVVEKRVENSKSIARYRLFRLLKKEGAFNISEKRALLCGEADSAFAFPFFLPFSFPQNYSHFFRFHTASFQDFPQRSRGCVFSTKPQRFSMPVSPWKRLPPSPKKRRLFLCFSDFSNFSTGTKTITPKKVKSCFLSDAKIRIFSFSRCGNGRIASLF